MRKDELIAGSVGAEAVKLLKDNLWNGAGDDLSVWALLDGQWVPDLVPRLIVSGLEFCCLYEGSLTPDRLYSSPYIVRLEEEHPLTEWLLGEGWGQGWGIYFQASAQRAAELYPELPVPHLSRLRGKGEFFASPDLEHKDMTATLRLRRHFRRYARVEFEEDGRIVVFRYFDPGVLRVFLPSCTPKELAAFFGPIRFFVTENFSEVESLNRPEEMMLFTMKALADDARHEARLRRQALNLATHFASSVEFPSVSGDTAALNRGSASAYVVIRAGQSEVFRFEQSIQFEEEVARQLMEHRFDGAPPTIAVAREAAGLHIPRARAIGLAMRGDISNFVTCSSRHGPDFPDGFASVKQKFSHLRHGAVTGAEGLILSDCLAAWAQGGEIDHG